MASVQTWESRLAVTALILASSPPGAPAAGSPPSLRDFTVRQAVTVGSLDPADWGPSYRGGRLQQIATDRRGRLYVATWDPCQLLRVEPGKEAIWELPDREGATAFCEGPWLSLTATSAGARPGQRAGVLLGDAGLGRVQRVSVDGRVLGGADLPAAFEAAGAARGPAFVYPGASGFLLDAFDADFTRLRALLPLPGGLREAAPSACHLLPDGAAGVFALWNPTRTIYRLDPRGEVVATFTLDPPELVANLEARLRRTEEAARARGLQASINPFLEFLEDGDGRLAVLYPFIRGEAAVEGRAGDLSSEGAVYRFTREGGPVDVIRGLDSIVDAAFVSREEIIGVHQDHRRLLRFRVLPPGGRREDAALPPEAAPAAAR